MAAPRKNALAVTLCLTISALAPFHQEALAQDAELQSSRSFAAASELVGAANSLLVAVRQTGSIVFFDARNLTPVGTFYPAAGQPTAVAFSPRISEAVVGLSNGSVARLSLSPFALGETIFASGGGAFGISELRFSPDGSYLAVSTTNGSVQLLDSSFARVAAWPMNETGPMRWVTMAGAPVLAYAEDGGSVGLHYVDGSLEVFSSGIIPNGHSPWAIFDDGTLLSLLPPTSAARVTVSKDFGRSLAGNLTLIDADHDRLAGTPGGSKFVTWGAGSTAFTVWNTDANPIGSRVLPEPPMMMEWVQGDTLVSWTPDSGGQLYSIRPEFPDAELSISISQPQPGSVLSGETQVVGTSAPIGQKGSVLVRVDAQGWHFADSAGSWGMTIDTRSIKDGPHTIEAAFTDGFNFSAWAVVHVSTSNNASADRFPVFAWFKEPTASASVAGIIPVRVGTANANRGNNSVDLAEVRTEGSLWRSLHPDAGSWVGTIDTRALSNGNHRLYARAFDGVAYSEPGWVDILVQNPIATFPIAAHVLSPPALTPVSAASEISGSANLPPDGTGWLEFRIAQSPWFQTSDVRSNASQWALTLSSAGGIDVRWSFCVRAAIPGAVGAEDCREFFSEWTPDDEVPQIWIDSVGPGAVTSSAAVITPSGRASDDHQLMAVFVRLDGGAWIQASGDDVWIAALSFEPSRPGQLHTVEAMAFDGFRFSAVANATFEEGSPAPAVGDGYQWAGISPGSWLAIGAILAAASVAFLIVWRRRR